jgi:sucrose-6-phosphate hydrolase SacC (GH32 family)
VRIASAAESATTINLRALSSPLIFKGDSTTAYRDPAAIYHDGVFHLYFTLVKLESDGKPYLYTAWSKSTDLTHWTEPRIFTPRDANLNFSSPGNVVRFSNQWILCHQTYPRPNGEKHGNSAARIWSRRSDDLENWSEPELLRVKGPEVPRDKMGRMIDPFLLQDKDEPGKWWCFFKQNGASMSWSRDFTNWAFSGRIEAGENVCVLPADGEYVMFHSPGNGVGVKRSRDLREWRDEGRITLGQKDWPWAKGRLTAGFVLDLRNEPRIGKYIMFFHGSGPENEKTMFDNFASIGLAWSDDLKEWDWPGKMRGWNIEK